MISHNISTLLFNSGIGIVGGIPGFINKKEILPNIKQRFGYLILGGIWGIALGAFFFIPAWFEKAMPT